MLQTIKKECKLHGDTFWLYPVFTFGAFLLGQLIVFLVMRYDKDPGSWFPLASVFAIIGGVIAATILDGCTFLAGCRIAFSMGCARKPLIAAQFLLGIVKMALSLLLCWLLAHLDFLIYRTFYAALPAEVNLLPFFWTPWLLLCLVLPPCCTLLVAGVAGKYGKRGGLVLYFLFLFLCIGGPRIAEYLQAHPTNWAAQLFRSFFALPPLLLIPAGILLLAALAAFSVHSIMTMSVEL